MQPELLTYISSCRALGKTDVQIHDALLQAGWSKDIVENAFQPVTDVPTTETPEPEIQPETATIPVTEPLPTLKLNKARLALFICGIILLLVIIGGASYFAYNHFKKPAVATSQNPTLQTPAQFATYNTTGLNIKFNPVLMKVGYTGLISSNLEAPVDDAKETGILLFTPTQLQTAKQQLASSSNENFAATLLQVQNQAVFSVTRVPLSSAYDMAKQATQTICTGSSTQFSSSNPVDLSRIRQTVVSNTQAFLILPSAGCDISTTSIFIDSVLTTSPSTDSTPQPSVVVHDSFIMSFPNSADLDHLSNDQKQILENITVK